MRDKKIQSLEQRQVNHYLAIDNVRVYQLGAKPPKNKRLSQLILLNTLKDATEHKSGPYPLLHAKVYEGTTDQRSIGCWGLNYWRMYKLKGDPGRDIFDHPRKELMLRRQESAIAAKCRVRLYTLHLNIDDLKSFCGNFDTRLALEIGTEWFDPSDGIILKSDGNPISSHAFPIQEYNSNTQCFKFQNSWGQEWGNNGSGQVSESYVEKRYVDSFTALLQGVGSPDLQLRHDEFYIAEWSWKGSGKGTVFVVEIRKGDRDCGWAFARVSGGDLVIYELFIAPAFRKRGFSTHLVERMKSFADQKALNVKLIVTFADSHESNRVALQKIASALNLSLVPSCDRFAYLVGADGKQRSMQRPWAEHTPVRPATIIGVLRPTNLPPDTKRVIARIHFGTNRSKRYAAKRLMFDNRPGNKLSIGYIDVNIPSSRAAGSLGRSFYRRMRDGIDDRLRIVSAGEFDSKGFSERQVHHGRWGSHEVTHFLFIHGYNVGFDDAAIRTAQLACDLKVHGETFLFSWPSSNTYSGYWADGDRIRLATQSFQEFASMVSKRIGDERLYIVAHSMGNRLLINVLHFCQDHFNLSGVAFCAPDVDRARFKSEISSLESRDYNKTIYVADGDMALFGALIVNGRSRVGLSPPIFTINQADTVLVRGLKLFDMGHSYFSDAPLILNDLYMSLHYSVDAERRFGLKKHCSESNLPVWILPS